MGYMQLKSKVVECLQRKQGQKLTAREIAIWIFENYPDESQEMKRRSTVIKNDKDIIQMHVRKIDRQREDLQRMYPAVKTTKERPMRYYYEE